MSLLLNGRGRQRWFERLAIDEPERALLAAVIVVALRDAAYGTARDAADARAYLAGPNFRVDCAALNLAPRRVLDLLQRETEEADARAPQSRLTDDQVRAIYARYATENELSLRALARRHNTTAATLSRRFAQLQLAARGNPYMTIAPRRPGRPRMEAERP